jgi:hypothetical protein|tara:strand:- start:10 stop:528 length:519 start_codon:yes stop_codon:yes gene_type:complete
MPRSQRQIGEQHGVSKDVIKRLKQKGVNIYDDQECKIALDRLQKRPSLKPSEKKLDSLPSDASIEDQVDEIDGYDAARILKIKQDIINGHIKNQRQLGLLIPIQEVKETFLKLGSVMDSIFKNFAKETAPKVTGLTTAETEKIIYTELGACSLLIKDSENEFWENQENKGLE